MSKNAQWLTLIVIAGIFGAFLGPTLAHHLSLGTITLLAVVVFGAIIAYCLWALSNNKGAAKADDMLQADARAMRAPEGKARIYVTRRGFVGSMQGMDVTLDEGARGQIKSGQMLMADVAPGSHRIAVATAKASLAKPADIAVEVGAGEVAVIDAMLEMGALKGSIKLSRLDAAKARENVDATKLMLWADPPA